MCCIIYLEYKVSQPGLWREWRYSPKSNVEARRPDRGARPRSTHKSQETREAKDIKAVLVISLVITAPPPAAAPRVCVLLRWYI